MTTSGPVEHFFRHDYGRIVAMLTRRVGTRHLERVEDAVQHALAAALTTWTARGQPEDPGGWLYRVAWNRLAQELRQEFRRRRALESAAPDLLHETDVPADPPLAEEVRDDMLRMLFVCCDDSIPRESQLVLALKILCGFSTAEIALRLFTSEANVHKRLSRGCDRLRQAAPELEPPEPREMSARLSAVHTVLYLLFNEGYLSAHSDQAIRRELCDEAVRLATLVAEHPAGALPESFALLALMHLHLARLGSRVDESGGLLLLEEQDRSLWDRQGIHLGIRWLERSAAGDVFSRFHAEAGIAAEHCLAPSYRETRWENIVGLYEMLERAAPSPLHTLNRAVAVSEWHGAQAGLAVLEGFEVPAWLSGSYLWHAVLADLHRRADHADLAGRHCELALALAPTDAVRNLLRRRLERSDRATKA